MNAAYLAMVLFLTAASAANIAFLFVALQDRKNKRTDEASSRALLALGVAEMCWIVPCWLQCLVSLFSPADAAVNADQLSWGCDLMGAYSVFASVAGMLLGANMAFLSYCHVVKRKPARTLLVTRCISASFGVGVAFPAFIFLVDGHMAFSGGGFCYIDWGVSWQAVAMEVRCPGARDRLHLVPGVPPPLGAPTPPSPST